MRTEIKTTWECDICGKTEVSPSEKPPSNWQNMELRWPNRSFYQEFLTCTACKPECFEHKHGRSFLRRWADKFRKAPRQEQS